jgi:hypothetical protein
LDKFANMDWKWGLGSKKHPPSEEPCKPINSHIVGNYKRKGRDGGDPH